MPLAQPPMVEPTVPMPRLEQLLATFVTTCIAAGRPRRALSRIVGNSRLERRLWISRRETGRFP